MTDDDRDCPFCWGTGTITVMQPGVVFPTGKPGRYTLGDVPVTRPCPEGCLTPEEVPF